jgi:mannose-6-phosphate isomerase-like protein (cupin superfamily)
MHTHKPFEITRWESSKTPSQEFLERLLSREGLQAKLLEVARDTHTPEMKFDKTVVWALVSGFLQVSFPGYGVIDLRPGDTLEVEANTLYDLIVDHSQPVQLLEAFRAGH